MKITIDIPYDVYEHIMDYTKDDITCGDYKMMYDAIHNADKVIINGLDDNHNTSHLAPVIGIPAMLEQMAEEANELAFIALKLARMERNENPVHGYDRLKLASDLAEEIADVYICLREVVCGGIISYKWVDKSIHYKLERMKERLKKMNKPKERSMFDGD